MCEVDRHLCRLSRRPVIADVYRRDELQAFSRFDCATDFGPHPATGSKNRNLHILRHGTLPLAPDNLPRSCFAPAAHKQRSNRDEFASTFPTEGATMDASSGIRVTLDLPAAVVAGGAEEA
jgi:hypothetical protein